MVIVDSDDPVSPAKALAAAAKQFPVFKIKAGYVSSQWMSSADCQKLSSLGSKPELLAKLAGALYASVSQVAGVLQAPMRDLALALAALEEKKKKESAGAAA
jgi:ribosomal protein L10